MKQMWKTKKSQRREEKKKKKHVSEQVDARQAPAAQLFDDSLVLGVFVHRTDGLQSDLLVSHPMVKVHVVEERSGAYLRKEDSHRPGLLVSTSSRTWITSSDHHAAFDFKKNKSIIPEWRGADHLQRALRVLPAGEPGGGAASHAVLRDPGLLTMEEARANAAVDPERGFRKIAWAFLKLVGTNGRTPGSIEVFEWWSKFPRNKYSSTLYVTVKGIALPEHVDPCMRSMMALQEERGQHLLL
ncbi:hypothetical protein CesoFtcFv8_018020 [Champsocephalus esox]|uniref:Uncharacterized protein n=1 Tax=Champsocephalus esox TaxID=159716 RepID=A0AAN8BKN2_9TELE|nr:hypothetical protein CesoFtcFv8_018020 [Champsocephalus esox]